MVVTGQGGLSEPALPAIPGIESFAGALFHSARWDHDQDLRGKRVAVIGTGASAIQFIPYIQPEAQRLTLFQRTPPWIMPHPDRPIRDVERGCSGRCRSPRSSSAARSTRSSSRASCRSPSGRT